MTFYKTFQHATASALSCLCLFACGCHELQFRHYQVVSSNYDEDEQATKVQVRFAVFDRQDMPVNDLAHENFTVYEDRIPSTSESVTRAISDTTPIGVTLLIDTSKSMYDASLFGEESNAVKEVKGAALEFVKRLQAEGPYRFVSYRFANDLQRIASIDRIPDAYSESDARSGRWTSLYHAISEAIEKHPENLIVVFTDGADNYSQNHGGVTLKTVLEQIRENGTIIYSIGSGGIETEHDRQGVSGTRALKRLSANGKMQLATDGESLASSFLDIENRITAIYTYEYYSPNLSGEHSLRIGVSLDERSGKSRPLKFTGGKAATPEEIETK